MKLEKVVKAANARGMYFDGKRGYSAYYSILTPHGYRYADSLQGIYRTIKQYNKVNYRITFRK